MSALVIIMSIGTKPHFKREAVRDTAGIGTREWQRTGVPHLRLAQGPPKSLIRHWAYSGIAHWSARQWRTEGRTDGRTDRVVVGYTATDYCSVYWISGWSESREKFAVCEVCIVPVGNSCSRPIWRMHYSQSILSRCTHNCTNATR